MKNHILLVEDSAYAAEVIIQALTKSGEFHVTSVGMADRTWACGCGSHLDRELNAARNIRSEGLKLLAVGQTDRKNRAGSRCKSSTSGGRVNPPAADWFALGLIRTA